MVAEIVAVVRGEDHQRVLPPPEALQRLPHAAQMMVELRDQPLVGRAHRRDAVVVLEGLRHFLVLEFAQDRVRGVAPFRGVPRHRQALVGRVHRVVRRGRDVGPMRLHIGQVQHPGCVALRLDEADRLVRRIGGLAVPFLHARGQAGMAHLPAVLRVARRVRHGDDVVRPGVLAVIALRAQPIGIGAVGLGMVAVVAIDQREPALAQQHGEFVLAIEQQALHAVRIGQHVRLASECQRAAALPKVPTQRDLAHAERHAVVRRAMRGDVAPRVRTHARRPADARLHIGLREAHAARRQRVDVRRAQEGVPRAAEVIPAQLVAHDVEHVADGHARVLAYRTGSLEPPP